MNTINRATNKPNAVSAISWSAIQGIGSTLIHFATLAALSRLLEPKVFGIMSILLVIFNIANLFAQLGLSSAIVQRETITRSALHSLYWLNVGLGCLVTLSLVFLSPAIATVFQMPELNNTTRAIAATFFVSCWSIQYQALAQRDLQFRRIALINLWSLVCSGIVSISLAWHGAGIWSLVAGIVAATLVRTASFFILGIRASGAPRWHFNWQESREMTFFGLHRFGAMFINSINSNIDQMLIGALLGAQALGYYNIAIRIVMQPIDRINPIVTRVAFPWLSRIQNDDARLSKTYLNILGSVMSINAPLLVAAGVLAEFYIPILLGSGWKPVIVLVQILSAYALLRTVVNAGVSVVLAKGRADWTFYWNLFLLSLFPAALFAVAQFGDVRLMAAALVVLQLVVVLAYHRLTIYPLTSIPMGAFLTEIAKPSVCALLAGLAALGVLHALDLASDSLNLLVGTLAGGLSYALMIKLFMPHHVTTLKLLISRRKPQAD